MLNRYEVKIVTEMGVGVPFVSRISRMAIIPRFNQKEVAGIKKGFVDNCAHFLEIGAIRHFLIICIKILMQFTSRFKFAHFLTPTDTQIRIYFSARKISTLT